jgi:8-oxo-dGTP pyrophosphatase MutT (NUDIX family)
MAQETASTVFADLAARFLLNLPASEFESFERLFFTIEEAHWFYLDFYRERNPKLPPLSLPNFASQLFQQVDFLQPYVQHLGKLFADFQAYKREVPTAGVVMLNENLDKVLLIRSWQRQQWSFPKGKISKGETHLACAIREATEETGFDVSNYIQPDILIDAHIHGRPCRLFLALGIPESASFHPLVRKEVSEIRWFPLVALVHHLQADKEGDRQPGWPAPTKFQSIRPFLRWIQRETKKIRQTRKRPKSRQSDSVLQLAFEGHSLDREAQSSYPDAQMTSSDWERIRMDQPAAVSGMESALHDTAQRLRHAPLSDPLRHFRIDHQQLVRIFEEAFRDSGG